MNEKNILVLIHKHLTGEISSDEGKRLQEWLSENSENQELFNEVQKSWELSLSIGETYTPDVAKGLAKFKARIDNDLNTTVEKTPAKVKPLAMLFRVAAMLIVAAGIGFLVNSFFSSTQVAATYNTGENESLVVTLDDGSTVWMQENSSLTFEKAFNTNHRNLSFTGNALFDITHNPALPFIIDGGMTDIQVLGTKFVFNTGEANTAPLVKVLEGKVQYTTETSDQVLIISANEEAQVSADSEIVKVHYVEPSFQATSQKLVFRDVPLNQAVNVIQHHYGVSIDWADNTNILECAFVSEYDNIAISDVLETLALSFGVDVQTTSENSFLLVGGTCPE
ncbi:MAG: FecR family protein [Bacteroidota bacterium]